MEVKEIAAGFPQLREKSVHFLFVGLVDFVLLGESRGLLINVGAQSCDGEIKRWRERSLLADSDVVVLEGLQELEDLLKVALQEVRLEDLFFRRPCASRSGSGSKRRVGATLCVL